MHWASLQCVIVAFPAGHNCLFFCMVVALGHDKDLIRFLVTCPDFSRWTETKCMNVFNGNYSGAWRISEPGIGMTLYCVQIMGGLKPNLQGYTIGV